MVKFNGKFQPNKPGQGEGSVPLDPPHRQSHPHPIGHQSHQQLPEHLGLTQGQDLSASCAKAALTQSTKDHSS